MALQLLPLAIVLGACGFQVALGAGDDIASLTTLPDGSRRVTLDATRTF